MRVFELAQSLKTTGADLLRRAQSLKLDVHSPLARLDDDDIKALREHLAQHPSEDDVASQAKLAAKRKRVRERQAADREREAAALNETVARAKRIEETVLGKSLPVDRADQAPPKPPPVSAEREAPGVPPTGESPRPEPVAAEEPVAEEPPIPAVAGLSGDDEAKVIIHAEVPEEAIQVAPEPPPEEKRVAAIEEQIDPDEELASAYLGGKRSLKPAAPKPARGRESRETKTTPREERAPSKRGTQRTASDGKGPGSDGKGPGRADQRSDHGDAAKGSDRKKTSIPKKRDVVADAIKSRFAPVAPVAANTDRVLALRGPTVVKDLAEMMGVRPNRVIADLMHLNVLASINQRVDLEMAGRIAEKYGYKVELERTKRSAARKPAIRRLDEEDDIPEDRSEDLVPRPPVVTFLGHVDHGKTSLMDKIRKAQVVDGEAGGITQHIGAYSVELNGRKITFLDTPGHAAFSAMRARGANLTDIAVIIIAADDGIMPQTKEVIRQARQSGVQMMVAINKCDLPAAKPERVRQQLQGEGLTPEEWGGDLVVCEVSAQTGKGIEHLLEMILLQADILELQANPTRRADGYVIEAQLERGLGPTATLLISSGTLKVGDVVLIGEHFGRLRGLHDDRGRKVKSAGPGTAVRVMGLSGVPEAGAEFRVMINEKRARELAEKFSQERKNAELTASTKSVSLDNLLDQLNNKQKQLNLIVKADTQGSVEAIVDSLQEIRSEKISLEIVHQAIGNVTSNDVQRAAAGNALIVGFQVGLDSGVAAQARHDDVRVQTFRIIYELFDYVKQSMLDLLEPEYREVVRGHAQIRAIFEIGKKGNVAGCQMLDGVVRRDARVRIKRVREVIYEGRIQTLHHFQDEVEEVREAQECGIRFQKFEDFAEGDVVECYVMEEQERIL